MAESKATKTWHTTSGAPRATHASLNGQTVPLDSTFSNGLRWPGDTAGTPEETAGCRCIMTIDVPEGFDITDAIRYEPDEGGVIQEHVRRVDELFDSADPATRALIEAHDHAKMLGATKRLRRGEELTDAYKAEAETLDKLTRTHVFTEDEVLFRGIDNETGWFTPRVGDGFSDRGYMFATMRSSNAADYGAGPDGWIIECIAKKGDTAMAYPRHDAMLFGRNTHWVITAVDEAAHTVRMVHV